jgi:hypothetical protein
MDKQALISVIEGQRKSRLIVYITGDRQPFVTRIADDTIPIFNRHLENITPTERISLFLYTRGGDLLTPLKLVKLIRSYCKEFEVLIPYRAHSAGTLITLGADKIIMGRLGELTPVDPTTMHPFNPQDPTFPQRKLEISAEDLNSYFLLAKEMAKIKEEQMNEPLKYLVERIHPLSLGNAYRVYRMGKMIAEKLLELHMDRETEEKKIQRIIKEITGEILCIHGYPINRDEARRSGLKVEIPENNLEKNLWNLYEIYATEMKLDIPFHPLEILKEKELTEFQYCGAYIESRNCTDHFIFSGRIKRTIRDNKPAFDIEETEPPRWKKIK